MKNIIIDCRQNDRVQEQINFANTLKNYFNFFFILDESLTKEKKILIKNSGFKFYPEIITSISQESINKKTYSTLKPLLFNTSIGVLLISKLKYKKIINLENKLRPILDKINPALILLNSDRESIKSSTILLKYAIEKNIPTIIPAFTFFAHGLSIRIDQKDYIRERCNSVYSKIMIKKIKNQSITHENKTYFYYIIPDLIALDKYNVLSPNPWIMGAHPKINKICVLTKKEATLLIDSGINENKIIVMGDMYYDSLFKLNKEKEKIKRKFIEAHNLKNSKIVVISLPPLAEHNILSWENHYSEIDYLLTSVCKLFDNVIVSLHPKMKFEDYKYLEKQYSVVLIKEKLKDFLPIADVFIATMSSTIIWSLLCEIPSIICNYFLKVNDTRYDEFTSLIKVEKRELLEESLVKIIKTKMDFSKDKLKMDADSIFDGNVATRYKKLIQNLIE